MFIGHYGVSYAAQAVNKQIPLWLLFIAVQLVDVAWAILVPLGIEKLRIVPGITATNPLDLYYMPYTHSLVGAALWSLLAYGAYRLWAGQGNARPHRAALIVALAVFSHWLLGLIVHRPDPPHRPGTRRHRAHRLSRFCRRRALVGEEAALTPGLCSVPWAAWRQASSRAGDKG